MGKISWYKRDPRAALTGMMELSLEERGAYNTVIDLIYDRDGDLPDDDRFLAGWCSCDVRVWRRIKQKLIDTGKLYVEGGKLRNRRADRGVDDALHRVASAADAGRASGRKRSAQTGNINDLTGTTVDTPVPTNIEDRSKKDKKGTPSGVPKENPELRGSRIAPDWQPTETDIAFALNAGMTHDDLRRESAKFLDYWLGAAGPKSRKSDWAACWRTWIRTAIERGGLALRAGGDGGGGGGHRRADSRQAGRLADTLVVLHRRGSLAG